MERLPPVTGSTRGESFSRLFQASGRDSSNEADGAPGGFYEWERHSQDANGPGVKYPEEKERTSPTERRRWFSAMHRRPFCTLPISVITMSSSNKSFLFIS